MQPTEAQVERTLAALERAGSASGGPSTGGIPRDTLELVLQELPTGLLEELEDGPAVRPDRLADASERLRAGDQPSDDELATRIVGRLVCDRLR